MLRYRITEDSYPNDATKILRAAGEHQDFLLVCCYVLGRLDEIMRLRWKDINFESRVLVLWTRKRKGGEWRQDSIHMHEGPL